MKKISFFIFLCGCAVEKAPELPSLDRPESTYSKDIKMSQDLVQQLGNKK